jgi:hypothetical protein
MKRLPAFEDFFCRSIKNIKISSDLSDSEDGVRGSVHRSTIHTEQSNKMQQRIKICYSMFI